MTMRWREDGEQLAIGMHNKMVVTVCAGGVGREGEEEGEGEGKEKQQGTVGEGKT